MEKLCVDYTILNKTVIPESYPFPRVEDLIEMNTLTQNSTNFSSWQKHVHRHPE